VVAACTGNGDAKEPGVGGWFDLVLLLPHGDTSSVLPCSGSQGCPKEGINLGPSGLNVVHGTAATSTHEDLLAAEALKLFDQAAHSVLVVVSASACVPAAALWRLVAAVKPTLAPGTLDLAVPAVAGPGPDGHSLEQMYDVSDLRFAAHPLNVARVQAALDALPTPPSPFHFDSGAFAERSDDWNGLSAVALSPKAVKKLLDQPSAGGLKTLFNSAHGKGLVHDLRRLAKSAPELECGIVRRAFAYCNYGYRTNVKHLLAPSLRGNALPRPTMNAEGQGSSPMLLAICAAGVPDKTVGAIFALETSLGSRGGRCGKPGADLFACAPFDLLVGVSPYPGDSTGDYLEAAGIAVLRQPAALGLSDLWNRIVRFAFTDHAYAHLVISNNDVLIPPGAVGGMSALLQMDPGKVATPLSQKGGGLESLANNGAPLKDAAADLVAFAEHPVNFRAVQAHLSRSVHGPECGSHRETGIAVPVLSRKSFVGFFFGLHRDLAAALTLRDGTGRLFNATARLNFGQEAELIDRLNGGAQVAVNLAVYVHHFRGQTLGGCQNGHRDCAQWQLGHHADQTYHINGYSPRKDTPRTRPWWEPDFGNDSPFAWKAPVAKHRR
jgi:hypothetical protein